MTYFSHTFNPEPRPADPQQAGAAAYASAKAGIWAIVLVYLGEPATHPSAGRRGDRARLSGKSGGTHWPASPAAGYSVVQGPATPLVRPHPAFWRLVHGCMVCYLLFMIYMLFQSVDDARQLLKARLTKLLCAALLLWGPWGRGTSLLCGGAPFTSRTALVPAAHVPGAGDGAPGEELRGQLRALHPRSGHQLAGEQAAWRPVTAAGPPAGAPHSLSLQRSPARVSSDRARCSPLSKCF